MDQSAIAYYKTAWSCNYVSLTYAIDWLDWVHKLESGISLTYRNNT